MRRVLCARCNGSAGFTVTAGDPATFWYRCEVVCLSCLPASRRWVGFVATPIVVSLDLPGTVVQPSLFDLTAGEGDQ